jgi:glycosyltransferase involved in cell wall biosynthesis
MSVLEPGRDSMTVQPKGWAELGAALIILARDAELRRRMGEYGHQKARRFGWDVVASQIVEVYEEARAASAGLLGAKAGAMGELHVHDAV